MKKRILTILILLLIPLVCVASTKWISQSSGEQTADAQVFTGTGVITSVQVITDGTNAATVTIHDGTSNSDKKIGEYKCDGNDYYCGWIWEFPPWVQTGIYVDVTGTGASYIVEYMDI